MAGSETTSGPLALACERALRGSPPPPDGNIELRPAPTGAAAGVFCFTHHVVVSAPVTHQWLAGRVDRQDITSVLSVPFLASLEAATGAKADTTDVVLGAPATGERREIELHPVSLDHPHRRIHRTVEHRTDVRAFVTDDDAGVLTVARGIDGRWELSVEVGAPGRGRGLGRAMAKAARSLVPPGSALFAQVAPGNVASFRMFMAAGYSPVCSETLLIA